MRDATPGTPLTATKTFALTVALLQIITGPTLQRATQGQAFSRTLAATGGTPPYKWSLAGTPPAWLTLSPTGMLSGTPTGPNHSGILVKVTDTTPGTPLTAMQTFSLPVTLPGVQTLVIPTTSPLPQAIQWHSYSQTLTATGGTPPYTWTFIQTPASTPPAWLSLSPTGVLSGTPTEPHQGSIIVKVTDNNPGISQTAIKTFALTATAGAPLEITTSPQLPPAMQGQSYSHTLTATGGLPPYTWSKTAVGVPAPWLQLSPSGVLSAVPLGPGQFGFGVKVTDSTPGTPLTTTANLVWKAYSNAVPILITTASPPWHATYQRAWAHNLTAVGGTAPYTWSLAGTPPAWLSLSSAGVLSANWPPVPTPAGSYSVTVKVQDATPGTPLTTTRTFELICEHTLMITTATVLPPATHGQLYSQTLVADAGQPPYTWSFVGSTLSPAGVLSGIIPTATTHSTFGITVKVTDSTSGEQLTAVKSFALSVQ